MHDLKKRKPEAYDFIIVQDLISRMLAQVSETKEFKAVFDALLSSEYSEIYLKDVTDYISIDKPVNFYTLLKAAGSKSETAVGYRIVEDSHNSEKNYGIIINQKKI